MGGYNMQVVAHEDDDLYFINPDIWAAIQSGLPVVTVYLSAGQISGNGTTAGQRARNRQLGIQAAYASMAGVPSVWSGEVIWAAGRQVERYSLAGTVAPVEVVFMGLPDGGLDAIYDGGSGITVLADGGLLSRTFAYMRADVVAVLAALMCRYQPTVLRVQDPLPDTRYGPDHADHVAAARMAGQAAAGFSDSMVLVPYRCYNIASAVPNVDAAGLAAKTAADQAYAVYDSDTSDAGWVDRMYPRWPRGTTWAHPNTDGAVQVFVVRSALLWTWRETGSGWSAPSVLAGAVGALAPSISVTHNADGRLQLFARSLTNHRIMSVCQTPAGSWGWWDFGSPNAGWSNAGQVGAPVTAVGGDGRIVVAVRNGGGGVSVKLQSVQNGGWPSTWADLGGTDVQEGLQLVVNSAGGVDIYARTITGALHWSQATPGAAWILAPIPVTSLPTSRVTRNSSGRVLVDGVDICGGPVDGSPAVIDVSGLLTVAAFGMDGTVRVRRQVSSTVWGEWQTLPA
jgi:LmbE family N-acetylglucosaminyl deacetylase